MTTKLIRKWQRVLAAFMDGSSWNAISARELGTTCLHSDVAGLEARGLKFDHQDETVPGYAGIATRVTRYTLRPESYSLARQLLEGMPAKPSSVPSWLDYEQASQGY